MFKNIGKKIMGLAKFITGLGIAFSAVGAIACAGVIIDRDEELFVLALLAAAVVFGLGFLTAWLGSFLLYGFGQLIHNSEESKELLKKISEQKPPVAPAVPATPVTPVGGGNSGNGNGGNGGNGGGNGGDDEGFSGFGGEGFEELAGKIKF